MKFVLPFELKFVILQLKSTRTSSVFWGYSEKKVPSPLSIITLCHNSSFNIWRQDGVFPYLISSLKPIFPNKMTASLEIVSLALFLFVLVSVLALSMFHCWKSDWGIRCLHNCKMVLSRDGVQLKKIWLKLYW